MAAETPGTSEKTKPTQFTVFKFFFFLVRVCMLLGILLCVCVCACACVPACLRACMRVTVKYIVLPPNMEDGALRNLFTLIITCITDHKENEKPLACKQEFPSRVDRSPHSSRTPSKGHPCHLGVWRWRGKACC